MSLAKRSWLPIASRKAAMRELTELSERQRWEADRHANLRAEEQARHKAKEAQFIDIIKRVQGYIREDGTQVMPRFVGGTYGKDPDAVVQQVKMEYENASYSLIFYARISEYFINRFSKVLTPSDINLVCEMVSKMIADELAQTMIAKKGK